MLKRTLRGDPRISKLARIITQYSTSIQKGEKVLISGTPEGETLILALYREVLRCGAYPTLQVAFEEQTEIFYQEASEHQLDYVPVEKLFFQENFDVTLRVVADTNLRSLTSVDLDKVARVHLARRQIKDIGRDRIRWNLCILPTDAIAQEAGMSLMEFENFYFSACFADEEDPVARWKELRERQDKWIEKLNGTKTIQILGEETDLTMSVEGRPLCNSWGEVNMPCGEIYCAPLEDSVEGTIAFSFPAIYNGVEIDDLSLRFKKGQVIEATASKNQRALEAMLSIDEGARRIGELGIGTNFLINKFTKTMLLDEKMGGTVHIALGDAYPECYGNNKSAIHIDILKDLKNGGKLIFDGVTIQENGKFTDEFTAD